MSEFKVGMAVKLAGGGTKMTIISPADADQTGRRWWCEWFVPAEGKYKGTAFPEDALRQTAED